MRRTVRYTDNKENDTISNFKERGNKKVKEKFKLLMVEFKSSEF